MSVAGDGNPIIAARMQGSLRIHLKREGAHTALCGVHPGSMAAANSKARRKGGWVRLEKQPDPDDICTECQAAEQGG